MSLIINPYQVSPVAGSSDWGGTPVDPDDVAGLTGWWKADAIGGLSNDDPVSTWANSGSGSAASFDMTQTLTARPLYKTGGPNGLPFVRFDGSNDVMFPSDANGMNDSASTIIAVLGPTSPPSNLFRGILMNRKYGFYYATDGDNFGSFLGQTVGGNSLPASGVWCVLAIVLRAFNDVDLYSLGVKVTRTNGTSLNTGTWNWLGSGTDGNQQFANMDLGEVCYYNVAHSESDVRDVATGLVAKWSAI